MATKDKDLYKNGDYIALLDENDQDYHYNVYQIDECVKASYPGSRMIHAVLFVRDQDNDLKFKASDEECEIEVSLILRRVIKTSESISDDDGTERTVITIARKLNNSLIDMAQQALLTGSEAEGEEEAEEGSDSYLGKRDSPDRKTKKRKASNQDDEEDGSSIKEKNTGTKAQKKEPKPPKEPKTPKEPKPKPEPKPKKEPKVKKVIEYKRGKFNIRVQELEKDPEYESLSNEFNSDCCDVCSNREVFRAVNTDNQILFQNILKNKNKITTLLQDWSAMSVDTDPLILALKRNKTWFIDTILNELKPKDSSKSLQQQFYKTSDSFGIESVDTGENSKYAYGVATRNVAMGRGNREGNNAFIHDDNLPTVENSNFYSILSDEEKESKELWDTLMEFCNVENFKKIIAIQDLPFEKYFAMAVRNSNLELAAMIAQRMLKLDGYGLNELHVRALTSKTESELGEFRAASVKKKSIGDYLITPIFCAAINPNLGVFTKMFELLDDRFLKDETGNNLMYYAAINPNHEILEYLLEQGMEFREANKLKITPLMAAAYIGRHKNVELLLKKGEISKKKSRDGMAAIHYAAQGNHWETIKVIIENGGDINLPGSDRMTALTTAAGQGHYETVKYLLSKGAKTIKKDKFKRTPLIVALMNCHSKVASLLIAHGCPFDEPDSSDNYPIHYACAYGCHGAIDMLIKAGANPNVYNSWKLTPIAVAMLKNHFKIINKLLTYPNIDVNCKDDNGRTLLSNSIRNITEKTVSFIELIIEHHNADVRIPDLKGFIPLHHLFSNLGTTFMYFETSTLIQIKNSQFIKSEGQKKLQMFIRLTELLTRNTLSVFNIEDKLKQTPLIVLMNSFPKMLSNLLGSVPSTSSYDNAKRTYVKKFIDFHSFLEGDLELTEIKWNLVLQILKKVSAVYEEQVNKDRNAITNELNQETPSSSDFCIKNEGILSLLISNSKNQLFVNHNLRAGLELASNENTTQSREEINHSTKKLEIQKKYFLNLVNLMINTLKINVQGKNYSPSAKSEVLNYLKSRWFNLYKIPEEEPSMINKMMNNPPAQSSNVTPSMGGFFNPQQNNIGGAGGFAFNFGGGGGFGGTFGGGLGGPRPQFQNQNTNQNQNKNKGEYINLSSTGVDRDILESLKRFRGLQIKEREVLTLELLDVISKNSQSSLAENWMEQHQFCSRIISMIPLVFFNQSVAALDLGSSEDAKYVFKSCKEMIQSNSVIGKKFIQLAQIGVAEYKARLIGSENSLLKDFSEVIVKITDDLSKYTDFTNTGTGTEIFKLELTERVQFMGWILKQFVIDDKTKREIEEHMKDEVAKPDKEEKIFAKNAILKERKKYQRSLIESESRITRTMLKNVILKFATLSNHPDRPLKSDEKLEILRSLFDLSFEFYKDNYAYINPEFLPYVKKNLLSGILAAYSSSLEGTTKISTVVESEPDLMKRPELQKDVSKYNASVLTTTHQFISKLIDLFSRKINENKSKPVLNELTEIDFERSNQFFKAVSSFKSTLTEFINTCNTKLSVDLNLLFEHFKIISPHTNDIEPESKSSILAFQQTELLILSQITNIIIDAEIFTDHSIGTFDMSQLLLDFVNSIDWNLRISTIIAENRVALQNAKIQNVKSLGKLLQSILTKSYKPSEPENELLKQKLTKVTFDQQKNMDVSWRMDLEEYLEEIKRHPLIQLFRILEKSENNCIYSFFRPLDFDVQTKDLVELESTRHEFNSLLLQTILQVFNYRTKTPSISASNVFIWPRILDAYFMSASPSGIIYNHEISTNNNHEKFHSILKLVNKLRSAFLKETSEFFISKISLKESESNEYLPQKLFKVYTNHGWNDEARKTILEIFEAFFRMYGDLCLDIPKIKNPLFFLAENAKFRQIYWIPTRKIDAEFFKYILTKVSNPNIRYISETLGTESNVGLFGTAFTSYNSNFLRALIAHPKYDQNELFHENFKANLHHCLEFIDSEDDLIFLKDYINKVKFDELIIENRKSGMTPFLNFIIKIQKKKDHLEFLKKNERIFIDLLRIMIEAGCNKNAEFDDIDKFKEFQEKGTTFKKLRFQKNNAVHLSLYNTPRFELIKYLVGEAGIYINHQDYLGQTPLQYLVKLHQDQEEIIKYFLEKNANPNILNKANENSVFPAAHSGNLDLIELLHKYKANLDLEDDQSLSPLTILIEDKNIPGIERIIKIGANVNFMDKFMRNSLHWAINFADHTANSSFEIEDILIRNGVEINTKDKLGRTPLHYPFVKMRDYTITHSIDPIESVNSLLEKKNLKIDEQDIFGCTPLMYASQRGSLVSALYLLEKKALINIENIEGNTPLAVAMMNIHDNLAITLLNNGAEWNTQIHFYHAEKRKNIYNNLLTRIRENTVTDYRKFVIDELKRHDEEQEAKIPGYNKLIKMHAFRWAIRNNWQGLAYMILSRGYDIGEAVYSTILERKFNYTFTLLTKREENTPYLFVGENGDNIAHLICLYAEEIQRDLLEKIFRVLIKKGIDLNAKNKEGHLSIHCAAICGSKVMIEYLMEKNINVNQKDHKGRTPMMLAGQNGKFNALRTIFKHTENKQEVDEHGRSVLHYLCMMKDVKDETLLETLIEVCSHIDCNKQDNSGKQPIHYLIKNSAYIKCIRHLIELSKDLNTKDNMGQNILHIALKRSMQSEIVESLIAKRVSLNAIDKFGRTVLGHLITSTVYSAAVKIHVLSRMVLTGGLNINNKSSFFTELDKNNKPVYHTMSALDYLFFSSKSEDLIIAFLKSKALFDVPNTLNQKSLEIILNKRKSTYLVPMIIENSTPENPISCDFYFASDNVEYKGKELSGMCYLIEKNVHENQIRELVFRGVDINLKDKNRISPFKYVVSEMKFKYITPMLEGQAKRGGKLILDVKVPKKFNLFKENPKHTTPLNYCIKYKVFDQVKILLMNNANPNFKVEHNKPSGYYLIKHCLKSAQFSEYLMRFEGEKDYSIKCASLRPLMKVSFDFKMKMTRVISKDKEEDFEVDPLYYAVCNKITNENLMMMLDNFPALNYVNPHNNRSAFAEAILISKEMTVSIMKYAVEKTNYMKIRKGLREDQRTAEQKRINLNLKMKFFDKDGKEMEQTYPLNKMMMENYDHKVLIRAIKHGANFNLQDGTRNLNFIMLAIYQNDYVLLKWVFDLVEENRCVPIDRTCVDNLGRTPIHMAVNSHKNGSFENIDILKLLSKFYDINKGDNSNLPPIHFASLQDSGRMLEALTNLGAREYEVPFGVRRAPTSLISFASFPSRVPNFEEDADIFYKQKEEEEKAKRAKEDNSVQLDQYIAGPMKQTSKVLFDENNVPYDIYMTKVDIKKGEFSGNVFYRMQLLHETNRDVFFLFTRYGRIGDSGQYQTTSFSTKNEAIQEFKNIFKSKSGNDYAHISNFQRIKKKYKLVKFRTTDEKEFLTNFYEDHHEKDLPQSSLSDFVKKFFSQIVSTKVMYSKLSNLNVDISKLPLSKLNKAELMQALSLLYEIKKVAAELKLERAVDVMNSDPEKIFELLDELCEMTSDYYELIPSKKFKNRGIDPMESETDINQNIMVVKELLDVEVAVKILLGANLNIKKMHPIDYCFNSMNIKLMELEELSVEREAILDYVSKSFDYGHPDAVKIFALERKGETERFQKHLHTPNRKLLWHGSRTMNFLGILNKGLKIAPPEAPVTGHMFGKGVYFSDNFKKSYGYTEGDIRVLLLCEVALGKSLELTQSQVITSLTDGYLSVKGIGINTPNPKKDVYIANGMILPLGEMIQRNNTNSLINLNYDEYVVYNEDQVKIRYMVCI